MNGLRQLQVKTACENCHVRKLCLPTSLQGQELNLMNEVVSDRIQLEKGDFLYKNGDTFKGLYAIKVGTIKTSGLTSDGNEQVTGFHLNGELVGMDAIDENKHPCDAITLSAAEVCLLPFEKLCDTSSKIPNLLKELTCIMSREIRREEHVLMLLGSATAEQRISRFLLNLHERMEKRGSKNHILTLQMSRQDIGNYLGLAIETVSRQFKNLRDRNLILVDRRNIEILDLEKLTKLGE